jgi:hypothetical protein
MAGFAALIPSVSRYTAEPAIWLSVVHAIQQDEFIEWGGIN